MQHTTTTNIMNRPASAYFNNNSNVMNQSPSNPNIPNTSTQSSSTGNLLQAGNLMAFNQNQSMMPLPASQQTAPSHTHISHPNLNAMTSSSITNSPITTHRPPILPNKMPAPGANFMRESQSQHSLRMNQQQQMMAPSMPNIAHASGFANNISASQSMQNVNQMPATYQMYHPQQQQQQQQPAQFQDTQQFQQNPQLSPNQQIHQASLLRGSAKMAEMGEMLKRQQRNQQLTNGGAQMHFTNSVDNISNMHIPTNNNNNPMMSPSGGGHRPSALNFHPQSPQKQLPPTAPKPHTQVCTI